MGDLCPTLDHLFVWIQKIDAPSISRYDVGLLVQEWTKIMLDSIDMFQSLDIKVPLEIDDLGLNIVVYVNRGIHALCMDACMDVCRCTSLNMWNTYIHRHYIYIYMYIHIHINNIYYKSLFTMNQPRYKDISGYTMISPPWRPRPGVGLGAGKRAGGAGGSGTGRRGLQVGTRCWAQPLTFGKRCWDEMGIQRYFLFLDLMRFREISWGLSINWFG